MGKVKSHLFILSLYSFVLFLLNFIRIFDNNFWGDEAFSINLVKNSLSEIFEITGHDVHPPLYYILLKYLSAPFDFNPFICHFVSLLPFALLLVFSIVVIRKDFGSWVALLFNTMISLMGTALHYNVEVRMYSWGALFLFISFYYSYKIIKFGSWYYYLLFLVASVAAAYTHYYCIISVSAFYLMLFLLCFLRKVNWFRFLFTALLAVILYIPWLSYLLKSVKQTLTDYWINDFPSFYACLVYGFSGHLTLLLVAVVALLSFVVGMKKTKRELPENCLVIMGVFSFLMTIFCGECASYFLRPVLRLHYLYPVSVVVWFVFVFTIKKFNYLRVAPYLVLILIISLTTEPYLASTKRARKQNRILNQTLQYTSRVFNKDDVLLTDNPLFSWSVIPYYYPNAETYFVSTDKPLNLSVNKEYWLICTKRNIKVMKSHFKSFGYSVQRVNIREKRKTGSLGTQDVALFKISNIISQKG